MSPWFPIDDPSPSAPIDRGRVLDESWQTLNRVRLRSLRDLEASGRIPSLVFSPMLIEDGRRLLISNLDMAFAARDDGRMVRHDDGGTRPTGDHPYSVSAFEFFRLFPCADDFRLATAVRISATFPLISPAVSLPTDPPRRWLTRAITTTTASRSPRLGFQAPRLAPEEHLGRRLDPNPRLPRPAFPAEHRDEGPPGFWDFLGRSVQFFCSPVEALLEARYSSSSFRNDGDISFLSDFFDKGPDRRPGFFTMVAFENSEDVALSWAITQGELARLRRSITREDVERDFRKTFGQPATPENIDAQIEAIESRVKTLGDVTPKEGEEDPIRRAERLINYRQVQTLMDWWFR